MKINFLIDHTINQKTLKKTETETFGHGEAAPDDILKKFASKMHVLPLIILLSSWITPVLQI